MEETQNLVKEPRKLLFLLRLLGYIVVFYLLGVSVCLLNVFFTLGAGIALGICFCALEKKIFSLAKFHVVSGLALILIVLFGLVSYSFGLSAAGIILKFWYAV